MSARMRLSLVVLAVCGGFLATVPTWSEPGRNVAQAGDQDASSRRAPNLRPSVPQEACSLEFDQRAEKENPEETIRAALSRRVNLNLVSCPLDKFAAELG